MQSIIIILAISLLISCSQEKEFNRDIWLRHNEIDKQMNPRSLMLGDLQSNVLKEGLSKKEVVEILGEPVYEGIEYRLPKGVNLPDSISLIESIGRSKQERQKKLNKYNNWFNTHSEPIYILSYPVGWSLIDPRSFVIKLDSIDRVDSFWVEQH